ncbi:hypothetical protein O6H91_17G065900 [Diphasiastrum complanatum]|uniref:Uncharacterized protein n=1 Tax=Diphasiastrum complanatum TaxID=34168 RepID=A0ACC2B7P2_DIPCM|nr:hypothetical protein O6H91_17G065900 [Diphasiastrum complanatum]
MAMFEGYKGATLTFLEAIFAFLKGSCRALLSLFAFSQGSEERSFSTQPPSPPLLLRRAVIHPRRSEGRSGNHRTFGHLQSPPMHSLQGTSHQQSGGFQILQWQILVVSQQVRERLFTNGFGGCFTTHYPSSRILTVRFQI